MPVHHMVAPSNSSGFPDNLEVSIYTPEWREALLNLSVLPKNTTQWPSKVLNYNLYTQSPAH